MWKFLLLWFVSVTSHQSDLQDLLSMTDEIFRDFQLVDKKTNIDPEALKLMVLRTYNLGDGHRISKRSLDEDEKLIQDNYGVYLLSAIQDVNKIPVRFPNDINILFSHNLLYITALEANGTNPESQLANDLVLFHYSSIQGIREMGRVPVLGGVKIAAYLFQNTTYIVAAEHGAREDPDFYEGSTVYRMAEKNEKIFLEKIQILNVIQPNDLKFWDYQDQLFLAVGTSMGKNSQRRGTLIYRWLGHHFDCLQVIPSKDVKSVMPFTIGSFMYLAIANYQDESGNLDINSQILQFSLQEMKFKPFQSIKTHGARDISYFNFEDVETNEKEHFLIAANSLGKNPNGSATSLQESVIYKFSDDYFIPFQSFRLRGATQWLPVKGPNKEFLILGSYTNGVVGYQYDGWRFSPVSLEFGQSFFGTNIQAMRAFYYFGDLFLTIADKSSSGNNVNFWKLSFANKNELEKLSNELETWCNEMEKNLTQEDFRVVLKRFGLGNDSKLSEQPGLGLTSENYLAGNFDQELRDELEHLSEEIKNLENSLEEAEELVDKYKTDSEVPIVLGSQEIASLDLRCKARDCCAFKNVKISKINGENFTEFLTNVVPLDDDLTSSVLEFEHVVLENDISTAMVNGHPAETLLDLISDAFVNAELLINGTAFITRNLEVVSGLFDGVRPDKEHMILTRGFQNIKEDIEANRLRIQNLKISGLLNGESIENLLRKPEIILPSEYKELNVNDMKVEGLVAGFNLTELFQKSLKKAGNQVVEGDLDVACLEADEVVVDSREISNVSISKILEELEERLCRSNQNPFIEISPLIRPGALKSNSDSAEPGNADEYIIIVEGLLKAKEFSDETNSTSLSHIINSSLHLNESAVHSAFQFSNLQAAEFQTDFINEIPLISWLFADSAAVRHIRGEKRFLDNVHVQEEAVAERINGINLEHLEGDVLRLKGDQIIRGDLKFHSVTFRQVATTSTNLGNHAFDRVNRMEMKRSVVADRLQVENLTLKGEIDSLSWKNLLEDSVYERDFVFGEKTISGGVRVENLNVTGRINELFFEEFVALTSTDANKILLDRNVTLNKPLNVDELHFEGLMNGVLSPNFEKEWLLQDATQIISGPTTFENVHMKSGSNLMNETVNNINLGRLFGRSLKINEDTSIKHLFSLGPLRARRIDVAATFNGAPFRESILRSSSDTPQLLSGAWFLTRGLTANGSFLIEGHLSGLNLTRLCARSPSDKISLIVGGSVTLKQEPVVVSKVNELNLKEKAKEVWMRDENVTVRGQGLGFGDVEFDGRTVLLGLLDGVNVSDLTRSYLSKTLDRVVSADYELENLVIRKWCRMHEASVGGPVNGMDLKQWAQNVLLQDAEQVVWESLRFENFQATDLRTEGGVNGLNLSGDVLRFDVEGAEVEGEKTFSGINVLNLTLSRGGRVQGVDVDDWKENSIKRSGDALIRGNLELVEAAFAGPFQVRGKVKDISFDSRHLLTTGGGQKVKGAKRFECADRPSPGIKMRFLEVSGRIDGIDLNDLVSNQAYSDRSLAFKRPKTFTRGLRADSMQVEGLLHGVNVTGMCLDAFNPVDVNGQREEYLDLLERTKALLGVVRDRAFFLDYYESVQTLKPNVKAAVPTLDSGGNYLLAVFTPNTMKFMNWNDYSESFVNTDGMLNLSSNVTFVASEIFENRSILYIETAKSAKIFDPTQLKEIEGINTSCIASFRLRSLDKECFFIGDKWNSSRILCKSLLMNDLQTYQYLDSKGSVQVSVLDVEGETFIAVINKEVVFDKIENSLSIYRFDPKLQHFYMSHTLAEINPVALSSVTYKGSHYLVSAGGHLPESVHNSILSIFRFSRRHRVFVRAQSIQVDTPVDVHFAILPTSQLALYVLTSNPSKPFVVFLHRGISGFLEETSGLSLYPGTHLYSFTDSRDQHFVLITGFGRGQVLKAGFKGERTVV